MLLQKGSLPIIKELAFSLLIMTKIQKFFKRVKGKKEQRAKSSQPRN
jgi:hypothetical protein